jgi:predicted dithiol-disulfide oxidoreductase (DUF899 family)
VGLRRRNGFNYDYFVSFKAEQITKGESYQNYELKQSTLTETVGSSAFCKASEGEIYHTYSTYARGVETINGAYHWLDLMSKGRDEAGLTFTQSWVRHHDRYGTDYRGPG